MESTKVTIELADLYKFQKELQYSREVVILTKMALTRQRHQDRLEFFREAAKLLGLPMPVSLMED